MTTSTPLAGFELEISHLIDDDSTAASMLDPLTTLPLHLPSKNPASAEVISSIAECGPPREVIMACQEALEQIEQYNGQDGDQDESVRAPQYQLITLIDVYGAAIPRLQLRKKSAPDTIQPLIAQLGAVIQIYGDSYSVQQGRSIIRGVSILVERINEWVMDIIECTGEDQDACKTILWNLLGDTVAICADFVRSCAAKRAFEKYYPHLVIRTYLDEGWEDGEETVQHAIEAANAIGKDLIDEPSIGKLMLLAHSDPDTIPVTSRVFDELLPCMLSAFQSWTALDECLALLTSLLHDKRVFVLAPEIVMPLITVLTATASRNPDPSVRQHCFSTISRLLSKVQPELRMDTLRTLADDPYFPPMRSAVVGLIKEAVLEGFACSSTNLFSSPAVMRVFGPILFNPNPPEFFSQDFTPDELNESFEVTRIVEVLAFYYVLIQRDTQNQTGVRDRDMIRNIERSFLAPLRTALARWKDGDTGDIIMPLVSLELGVERVDSAIAMLNKH
ncbi:hypothetical protein AMATHDRAFT_6284 [Amanita thiersii Skay4041]|uniref:Uncharacterized protein n=1 Tax=Amanita thiersii Skay4041 TaxID=703135 RepID=A0A2A9NJJ2_9AGAR|nr:hypothetical protein AMATHDRAFT_6284 [Amanita thiersii Skay4041]